MALGTVSPITAQNTLVRPRSQVQGICEVRVYLGLKNDIRQLHLVVQNGKKTIASIIGASGVRKSRLTGLQQGDRIGITLSHPERMGTIFVLATVDYESDADLQLPSGRFFVYEHTFVTQRANNLLMLRVTKSENPAAQAKQTLEKELENKEAEKRRKEQDKLDIARVEEFGREERARRAAAAAAAVTAAAQCNP